MAKKNVEIINDTNYSITDRSRPVKKKRHIFARIGALVLCLLLALCLRYYIETSEKSASDNSGKADDVKVQQSVDVAIV